MANKKISELQSRTPVLADLMLVGDPSSGYSYKCTITSLSTVIESAIGGNYVTLATTQTISGAKTFSNNLTLTSVTNAPTTQTKFLTLNASNIVNYRTGAEVLSDIGGQGTITLTTTGTSGAATFSSNTLNIPQYQGVISLTTTGTSGAATLVSNTLNIPTYTLSGLGGVPTTRSLTINGTAYDLSADRSWSVGTVTSVAATAGTGISISGSPITSSGTLTITNTAPDQTVVLTAGTGISVSGTYPNFTITNSSPSTGGTVTSVAALTLGTTGTDLSSTVANSTTTPVITLNVPTASATNRGALSSTDWSTFNNKQSAISLTTTGNSGAATFVSNTLNIPNYTLAGLGGISGSGTTNYIPKFTSSSAIGNSQVFDNGTNVGIGTATPAYKLDVSGDTRIGNFLFTNYNNEILVGADATGYYLFNGNGATSNIPITIGDRASYIRFLTSTSTAAGTEKMRLDASGNLGLGVVPQTWTGTNNKAFQFGNAGALANSQTFGTILFNNSYYNSGYKYLTTAAASAYVQDGSTHIWYQAGTGSANAAISFTQAMTLDASGRLGIGTTSPGAPLDVVGSARISGDYIATTSGNTGRFGYNAYYTSTGFNLVSEGAINLTFGTNSLERMRITSGGDVAIGATTANARLRVVAGSGGSAAIVAQGGNVEFYKDATPTYAAAIGHYSIISGTFTNDFLFHTYNGSWAERMRITSGGNVVVGGTTAGTSLNTSVTVNNANAGNYAGFIPMTADVQRGYYGGTSAGLEIGVASTGFLSILTSGSERMRITSAGLVGIGTSSPDVKLTVDGATGGNTSVNLANFYASKGQTDASYLRIQGSRSATAGSRYIALDVFDGGATSRTLILNQSGGEVYIAGTTDQGAYNLQVNGTGVWGAGAYVNGSDSALKQNIQPLDNSLDIVKQMKPVTYTYKDFYSKDNSVQTGFIAQDLQVLLKDKNYLNGIVKDGTYLSVAYQNLIPLLVKAIQEQQLQIENLKK